ncbi:hypothetical protein TELCIR_01431 [Teladorsagia circumcincta]|uniref:Leishmanolysin-like peptidase n=1 Tax=Teladorsagia circumcincta TaxID=45464 RepID=A0A2G9V1W1_TELCI|nr:hypothetical protein TELCIR_01431 [Teladorsagia circumcincta]
MSAVSTTKEVFSRVTLALFEDSGWYKVNYDKAEEMMWGRNLGCKFAKQSCLTWMKNNMENPFPFCNRYGGFRCSAERLAKVRCNLVVNSTASVPKEYDYNIENLYQDGKGGQVIGHGSVRFADYCPYYEIPDDMETAKCTRSSSKYTDHSLEATCEDNRVSIGKFDKNSTVYQCYHEGQTVQQFLPDFGNITIRIVCPPCAEVCGHRYCAPDEIVREQAGDSSNFVVYPEAQLTLVYLLVLILI